MIWLTPETVPRHFFILCRLTKTADRENMNLFSLGIHSPLYIRHGTAQTKYFILQVYVHYFYSKLRISREPGFLFSFRGFFPHFKKSSLTSHTILVSSRSACDVSERETSCRMESPCNHVALRVLVPRNTFLLSVKLVCLHKCACVFSQLLVCGWWCQAT